MRVSTNRGEEKPPGVWIVIQRQSRRLHKLDPGRSDAWTRSASIGIRRAADLPRPTPPNQWHKEPGHGLAVTFTRMKRGGEVPMRKLSRTFSVVALLVITVVVAALKESG